MRFKPQKSILFQYSYQVIMTCMRDVLFIEKWIPRKMPTGQRSRDWNKMVALADASNGSVRVNGLSNGKIKKVNGINKNGKSGKVCCSSLVVTSNVNMARFLSRYHDFISFRDDQLLLLNISQYNPNKLWSTKHSILILFNRILFCSFRCVCDNIKVI